MALENPDAEVVAVDISDAALEVASSQDFSDELSRTGAKAPVFVKADVLADVPAGGPFAEEFDIILSNPPYVMDKEKALMRTNVLDHEPHLALFVSDDDPLIFYRAVARWASRLLSSSGFGIVEINEALGAETAQVFIDAGFPTAQVLQDFSGRDRFVHFSR
jgi:release factor glutamine methyltransferase